MTFEDHYHELLCIDLNGPWIKYRLSDESKAFYEDIEEDEECYQLCSFDVARCKAALDIIA